MHSNNPPSRWQQFPELVLGVDGEVRGEAHFAAHEEIPALPWRSRDGHALAADGLDVAGRDDLGHGHGERAAVEGADLGRGAAQRVGKGEAQREHEVGAVAREALVGLLADDEGDVARNNTWGLVALALERHRRALWREGVG